MIIKSENSIAASTRMSHMTITCDKHVRLNTTQNHIGILCKIMHDCMLDVESSLPVIRAIFVKFPLKICLVCLVCIKNLGCLRPPLMGII